MDTQLLTKPNIDHLLQATAHLIKLPTRKFWVDYDEQVDTVYMHFTAHPASTHSQMDEEGVIFDFNDEDEVVGLTILEASQRGATSV